MITNLVGGVFDLLGRAGGARRARAEDDVELPDGAAPAAGFAVPLARGDTGADGVGAEAARVLDDKMRHSPNPRSGRIERGVYRGKTPAEAALSAQDEAKRNLNKLGGPEVGRIGSDRSDYGQRGGAFGAPFNRASAGLDRLNETQRAAQESNARRAAGDMSGVSFWRNNGDGTATAGKFGADNKAATQTRDIVPRVRPGETRVVGADQPLPKGKDKNTHLIFEGMRAGRTKVQATRTRL